MNYWHIQMHPANQEEFGRKEVTRILTETGYIGVGEWNEGAGKIRQFKDEVQKNDIVLVRSKGPLALVEIIGDAEYEEYARDGIDWFENRRKVKILAWHNDDLKNQLGRTVDGIFNTNSFASANKSHYIKSWHQLLLNERMENEVAELLKSKFQVVLQGPPGTGKTRLARLVAEKLVTEQADMKLIQFHPAYAYEDFVRGIVAETNEAGHIEYRVENKVLGEFASRAAAADDGRFFVLIIDEINRANLPSVLGELIYALEYRGEQVESVYGVGEAKNRSLMLPKNLLIIGTMNTADRSVGHLDYAIRRRFAFVTVLPNAMVVPEGAGRDLFEAVEALFVKPYLSNEFQPEQVQPGHSYFITSEDEGWSLPQKLEFEIKPLLREYLKDGILLAAAREKIEDLRA